METRRRVAAALAAWNGEAVVAGPDVDGLLSAGLVMDATGARLAGIYTTSRIVALDGAAPSTLRDALWLDHDIDDSDVISIGQHLIHHGPDDVLPRRHAASVNPHDATRVAWHDAFRGPSHGGRDKYPFGTAHLLADALGTPVGRPGTRRLAWLAHADGAFATAHDYAGNAAAWRQHAGLDAVVAPFASDAYRTHASCLAAHAGLVQDLRDLGVRVAGSHANATTRLTRGASAAWSALRGHQTFPGADADATAWWARLRATLRLLAEDFHWTIRLPAAATAQWPMEYRRFDPAAIAAGNFDEFLQEHKAFSHAFVAKRDLRVTVGPPPWRG